MTALAAVFDGGREWRSTPEARLDRQAATRRMLDAAPHRGAGDPMTWPVGRAALGCRSASPAFAQSADGSAAVVDGRLDNLVELRSELALSGDAPAAAILLAAYRHWGEQAPGRLLGDFAFVIWDALQQRLLAARDALGQRPIFYAQAAGTVMVASEPQQILAHRAMPPRMNEGVIAEFLSARPRSVDETVWAGLMRLRPAHLLIASADGVTCARYWDFDPAARIDYRRDDEYVEHFAALFRDAVERRTKGLRSVGVFLSGGLDSSAIAGVAESLARNRGGPAVRTYSLTFPNLPVDETPYIDAVTRQWDLPSTRLAARPPARREVEAEIDRYRDLPAFPNGAILNPLRAVAAADVDVVLTGYGGDDWFTGSPLHTADLLRDGRLLAAATQIRHDMRLPGRGYSAAALLRSAIAPLLSPGPRRWLRPIAGSRRPTFPWIAADLASRVALDDRIAPEPQQPHGTRVQSEIRRIATSLSQTLGDELEDRAAAAAGLDQRHPFNDRRLAEFGFALPERLRWEGGETKVVMRRALESVLPEAVRARNDKAEFTPTLVQAIEGLGGRAFLSHLAVAEAGWVNLPAIQNAYDEMTALYSRGEESYIPLADAVWSVAAVELWLVRQTQEVRE